MIDRYLRLLCKTHDEQSTTQNTLQHTDINTRLRVVTDCAHMLYLKSVKFMALKIKIRN